MNWGGNHKAACGFTIVEVLIVIAVSGMMLLSGILLVNGRQGRTEFTTGVNDELQGLQQILSETSNGYYPNNHDFACQGSASGPVIFSLASAGSGKVGSNAGCIFLGKAIQFGLGSTDPSDATLGIIPVVGNQFQTNAGVQVASLTVSAAIPRPAYPVSVAEESRVPKSTFASVLMEYGLHIATSNDACIGITSSPVCYMPVSGGSYRQTGMAAFIAGDGTGTLNAISSGTTNTLQSNSQQLSLYGVAVNPASGVPASAADTNPETASSSMGNVGRSIGLGNLDPAKNILICIASATTNQSGLFMIGGSGSLSVTLTVKGDATCK